jgi:hypothetical protein
MTTDTNQTLYTNRDTHSHVVNVPAFDSGAATATAHGHTVDVAATTSTSAGSHTHTCDVGATASSQTSAGMPYLQLLVCRKN